MPSPEADFDLVEPFVGPDVARGYLIMSGKAAEVNRQLVLRVVDPFSSTAFAIYKAGREQLFSAIFRELTKPSDPTDTDIVMVESEASGRSKVAPSTSLLKRFGQTLVDAYGFQDHPLAETHTAG